MWEDSHRLKRDYETPFISFDDNSNEDDGAIDFVAPIGCCGACLTLERTQAANLKLHQEGCTMILFSRIQDYGYRDCPDMMLSPRDQLCLNQV